MVGSAATSIVGGTIVAAASGITSVATTGAVLGVAAVTRGVISAGAAAGSTISKRSKRKPQKQALDSDADEESSFEESDSSDAACD